MCKKKMPNHITRITGYSVIVYCLLATNKNIVSSIKIFIFNGISIIVNVYCQQLASLAIKSGRSQVFIQNNKNHNSFFFFRVSPVLHFKIIHRLISSGCCLNESIMEKSEQKSSSEECDVD